MLSSMTGFGDASGGTDTVGYSVEIKSLNGKYFKSTVRLPELLSSCEPRIEQILRRRLVRGSIVYTLRMKDHTAHAAWEVNLGAIKGYLAALQKASELAGEGCSARVDLAALLQLPGVCEPPELSPAEGSELWQMAQELTNQAVDRLIEMRVNEGKALHADLDKHTEAVKVAVDQIRARAGDVARDYARRLHTRVKTMLSDAEIELREEDLAREVAVFAERADINEELARLDSHLAQFRSVMVNEDNAGRKLEFLAQEMLRETNTIGSKANDAAIAHCVVEIKGHIDRIKEQVMNVV